MEGRIYRMAVVAVMLLLIAGVTAWAQTTQKPQQERKTEVKVVNHDGVVSEALASDTQSHVSTFTFVASEMGFESKVVKGVPFSADTVTEFTQVLGNGQRLFRSSSGSLYRDSEGRTRREQTIDAIGPYTASAPVQRTVMINDPVAGESYMLNAEEHTAIKTMASVISGVQGGTSVAYTLKSGDSVQTHVSTEKKIIVDGVKVEKGSGVGVGTGVGVGGSVAKVFTSHNARTEPLGTRIIEGVSAEGTKTIETIAAGTIGNDTPIEIVSERWYSEELGVVVKTVRDDPLSGLHVYQLKNIRRGEPSADLFQIPSDYTIKDATIKIQAIRK